MSSSRSEFLEQIKLWPQKPGVYLMRDESQRILYVGKAKNLRSRIRSYFQQDHRLTPKTRILVNRIVTLEFTITHTELEALLLECNLIKSHRPRYNVRLKDDKNYPYVVLDFTHPFPQFRIARKVVLSPNLKYFGPFNTGVKELSRFLLKTFQLRDCSDTKFKKRTRPCLNYEIGICTAPCVALVSQEDYSRQVQEAILFLGGKKRELVQIFKKEMDVLSKNLEYERARSVRDKIRSVETITEKQNAVFAGRLMDVDVIGCFEGDQELQWVVLFIRSGILTGRRAERTPLTVNSVEETTREFLEQFYSVSLVPDEIWISQSFGEERAVSDLLSEKTGKKVRVRLGRNEKALRLLGMAYENAKLIYQERGARDVKTPSESLREILELPEVPSSIEGIDVSNIQGTKPAVALVHFSDEHPLKSRYRIYYPKTVEGQNDFAMIYETMQRRLADASFSPPDLFLIDGGKGQLSSALRAIEESGKNIPVCSLAKARTESAFTSKKVTRSEERIFIPNRKNPIILREGHPALRLLQQVRDEAHRFSVKSHRVRRENAFFEGSSLLEVKGIGRKIREKLLKQFASIEKVMSATDEELRSAGIPQKIIERLKNERGQ